jgi:2-keto-4-pentenoate hydratase/2-oxohepta-3-ene-1,7-dioic acid hydratase in catechol pathway
VRIARFVHRQTARPDGKTLPAGVAWGVVEGVQADGLTVAAIEEHPFGPIRFSGDRWALSDVRLLSPILPSKVVAVGKNYADHVAEMAARTGERAVPPDRPVIFLKPSTAVIGTGDVIRLPADSAEVEHEAELGIVLGRPAKDVPAERAMEVVLGYLCGNDVTARDEQRADGQWARAKGHDSFCPIGPWIETDVDPADLRITASVNGDVRQDGRTSQLIHGIAELIAYMSNVMTLLPGDVLLTGTPAGVGPLTDGDSVTVEIEGIGALTNPVRARVSAAGS